MDRTSSQKDLDQFEQLKVFDESKAGVKGVVDGGALKIPRIFVQPPDELADEANRAQVDLKIPAIDLTGINNGDHRRNIVDEIRYASEKWGFFQVVNHAVADSLLRDMISGIRPFHEQDFEIKKEFYTRDRMRPVRFESNIDLILDTSRHTDPSFLTIHLQDNIGGLQVLHDNQWANVQPIDGSFVVNIGDLLQIVLNGKFKSMKHRVLANQVGPRISAACLFTGVTVPGKIYGPIEDLI